LNILYLVIFVVRSIISQICQTEDGDKCIFPFVYKRKTFFGCTQFEAPDTRPWCSTKVNARGEHVASQFGHCSDTCPRDLICSSLRVTDSDDDFASGIYESFRIHKNKPVYLNVEKDFHLFWISEEIGWAIGQEEGIKTGGAFYSSGPSYMPNNVKQSVYSFDGISEPWLGQWRDKFIRVECADSKERIPFRYNRDQPLYSLPSQLECEEHEICLPRKQCPYYHKMVKTIARPKVDAEHRSMIITELRTKVCNYEKRGLCCNICEDIEEKCQDRSQCPGIQMKLNLLESNQMNHSESVHLYNQLFSKLCSRKNQFCC